MIKKYWYVYCILIIFINLFIYFIKFDNNNQDLNEDTFTSPVFKQNKSTQPPYSLEDQQILEDQRTIRTYKKLKFYNVDIKDSFENFYYQNLNRVYNRNFCSIKLYEKNTIYINNQIYEEHKNMQWGIKIAGMFYTFESKFLFNHFFNKTNTGRYKCRIYHHMYEQNIDKISIPMIVEKELDDLYIYYDFYIIEDDSYGFLGELLDLSYNDLKNLDKKFIMSIRIDKDDL